MNMWLHCAAVIPDDNERKSIMQWVRKIRATSYSELGEEVSMTFDDIDLAAQSDLYWAIIHTFEQYPEHLIEQS